MVLSIPDRRNGYNAGDRLTFEPEKAAILVQKGWASSVIDSALPSEITAAGGVDAFVVAKRAASVAPKPAVKPV